MFYLRTNPCKALSFIYLFLLAGIIFTQDIQDEIIIEIPVFLNDEYLNDISTKISETSKTYSIDKRAFLESIEKIVKELQLLDLEIYENEFISLADLENMDFRAFYSEEDAQIYINIDYNKLKPQILKIASYRDLSESMYLKQSPVSGFINFYPVYAVQYQDTDISETLKYPYRLGLDSALNISNFVLEGTSSYNSDNLAQRTSEFDDERIVYKFDSNLISMTSGDAVYKISSLQSRTQIKGFSVNKDYSLNPNIQSFAGGDAEFVLDSQSNVKILVNGQIKKTLSLEAGSYKIEDFIFIRGLNKVQIVIRDYYGRERIINYTYPFDSSLLGKGLNDYSFVAGSTEYDENELRYSAYLRRGITNNFTFGINTQGDRDNVQSGLESGFSSFLGNMHCNFAVSKSPQTDFSKAALLKYSYMVPGSRINQVFSINAKNMDEYFYVLGSEGITNPYIWSFTGAYSISPVNNLSTTSAFYYDIGRDDYVDRLGLNLMLNYSYKSDLAINISFSPIWESSGYYTWEAGILFTLTPSSRKSTVRVSNNIRTGEVELSTQFFPEKNLNSPSLNAKVSGWSNDPEDDTTLDIRTSLQSYRFQLYADEIFEHNNDSFLIIDNLFEVRAGTAFVFTDEAFSVTRPVRDSFVIIKADQSLKGQDIYINPNGQNYDAKIGFLPAALPGLSSYNVQSVFVNAADLPMGYDLGENFYNVYPSYKSGYTITVGKGAKVYLGGYLENSKGEALSLTAGELVPFKQAEENIMFFTDREGYFEIQGVRPGKYNLVLYDYPEFREIINIHKNEVGFIDAGKIIIPGTED